MSEEARKVLGVADFTSSAGVYVYDLAQYVRELEPGSLRIRTESHSFWSTMNERPIESRPVEVLLDGGWVVREPGGNRYFAPDAHVLLSDEFLDTHCMQLRARDESHSHLVGLGFRPVRIQSRRTRIQGVLWLSRETGGLEWLEFSYLNLPGLAEEVQSDQIGGRVDFRSLPDGAWIVSKWYIRMPRVIEEVGGILDIDLRRPRLKGIVEEGASETNPMGAFRFCGIPTDHSNVKVTAGEGAQQVSVSVSLSKEEPVLMVSLRLVVPR